MTQYQVDLNTLWPFELCKGHSRDPSKGACLLDAVSWFEYGKLDDRPACVSEFLAVIGRMANDLMESAQRQELRQFILRLPGTVDQWADTKRRAYADFQVRKLIANYAPYVLFGLKIRDCDDTIGRIYDLCQLAEMQTQLNRPISEKLSFFDFEHNTPINATPSGYKFFRGELIETLVDILDVGCAIPPRAPELDLARVPQKVRQFAQAGGVLINAR